MRSKSHVIGTLSDMAARRAFTVDEWHRMGEAGLFGEGARMELLDGEVIEMSPIGSPHAGTVNRLTQILIRAVGERAVVSVQNPVVLDEWSEPQPDLAVLAPREDFYQRSHARPSEILLLIEVSDSTLAYDRGRKASYYAGARVPETWVVDLANEQVLVMRSPASTGYRDVRTLRRGAKLGIEALDGIRVSVNDFLVVSAS